jgi:hypothetical protein
LSPYAGDIKGADPSDGKLIAAVETLRQQLEIVFGQRITLKGEKRERSGVPVVVGSADVRRVKGIAAGILASNVTEGELRGTFRAEEVESGGVGSGVKVDNLGRQP